MAMRQDDWVRKMHSAQQFVVPHELNSTVGL